MLIILICHGKFSLSSLQQYRRKLGCFEKMSTDRTKLIGFKQFKMYLKEFRKDLLKLKAVQTAKLMFETSFWVILKCNRSVKIEVQCLKNHGCHGNSDHDNFLQANTGNVYYFHYVQVSITYSGFADFKFSSALFNCGVGMSNNQFRHVCSLVQPGVGALWENGYRLVKTDCILNILTSSLAWGIVLQGAVHFS